MSAEEAKTWDEHKNKIIIPHSPISIQNLEKQFIQNKDSIQEIKSQIKQLNEKMSSLILENAKLKYQIKPIHESSASFFLKKHPEFKDPISFDLIQIPVRVIVFDTQTSCWTLSKRSYDLDSLRKWVLSTNNLCTIDPITSYRLFPIVQFDVSLHEEMKKVLKEWGIKKDELEFTADSLFFLLPSQKQFNFDHKYSEWIHKELFENKQIETIFSSLHLHQLSIKKVEDLYYYLMNYVYNNILNPPMLMCFFADKYMIPYLPLLKPWFEKMNHFCETVLSPLREWTFFKFQNHVQTVLIPSHFVQSKNLQLIDVVFSDLFNIQIDPYLKDPFFCQFVSKCNELCYQSLLTIQTRPDIWWPILKPILESCDPQHFPTSFIYEFNKRVIKIFGIGSPIPILNEELVLICDFYQLLQEEPTPSFEQGDVDLPGMFQCWKQYLSNGIVNLDVETKEDFPLSKWLESKQ